MDSSGFSAGIGGFVTVLAVSGSVAFVAAQVHKSLLSQFLKELQSDLRPSSSGSCSPRKCAVQKKMKKVRFAEDVVEPSSNNKEYRRKRCSSTSQSAFSVS